MKIAIASMEKELSSKIDPRLGRARYIIIHDSGKSDFEVIDNQEFSQLSTGAGVKAAEVIVDKNVDYIVSQNFGPKALQVFKAANVKAAVISSGTIAEAIENIKNGQFYLV